MIIRVVVSVEDKGLRNRLGRMLTMPDLMRENLSPNRLTPERLAKMVADVLVVCSDAIPEPIEESVYALSRLPELPDIVVLLESRSPTRSAEFLAAGCSAALYSGLPDDVLGETLQAILEKRRLRARQIKPEHWVAAEPRLSDFVNESPIMNAFVNIVRRVVKSDVSLLIQGETGVGKERLGRAIHAESHRARGPFVAVNCGALPEALLESELFGHVEGAFTGATRSRRGWFELAHGGSVFLDEIGELPYHLQVKLLRVLQEHEIQPIGGEKALSVDVRVIAATNSDLEQGVDDKRFRRDLFHRLNVVTLNVPPLRERREDIPGMAQRYVEHFRAQIDRGVTGIAHDAVEALAAYEWPGNVRELMNVIERAMLLCEGERITLEDLPRVVAEAALHRASGQRTDSVAPDSVTLSPDWLTMPLNHVRTVFLENLERNYLEGLLRETEGRIGETARRAGIRERSLYDKMKRHGLRKEDFRKRRRPG